jgi:uracil-DNA glycosylase family 4
VAPRARQPSLASSLIPDDPTLADLVDAAAGCQACGLWQNATQTVFGEGSEDAEIRLEAAGIDRRRAYVTNVVKHFKWTPRGKVRLHQKPNAAEQAACRPWLEAELRTVRPQVLVALGATAAKALLGSDFRVTRDRGRFVESALAPHVLATVHPSSILRTDDGDERRAAMQGFVDDLAVAAGALR